MLTYCKSLHPDDYEWLTSYVHLFNMLEGRIPASIEHFHRRWESAIALASFERMRRRSSSLTLLEVGSGGSLFAPLAALHGYSVTVCDPSDRVNLAKEQADCIGYPITILQADFMEVDIGTFDYVVCLSVIEHVAQDMQFWAKLLDNARCAVALTTDFALEGGGVSPYHLRTYTPMKLEAMIEVAVDWLPLGKPDYVDNGAHVYNYSFASVCLGNVSLLGTNGNSLTAVNEPM